MRRVLPPISAATLIVASLVMPSRAAAQPSSAGPRIGGFVSGSLGDGGPASDFGLVAGYRFTPRWGVELDASYIRRLNLGQFPVCPPEVLCITVRGGQFELRGRALAFTGHVVADLPGPTRWLRPYVVAGGGLARLTFESHDSFFPIVVKTTETAPVVSAGGGVDVPLWRGLTLGVDLRYQRIVGKNPFTRDDIDGGLNVMRVGSLLSYRF